MVTLKFHWYSDIHSVPIDTVLIFVACSFKISVTLLIVIRVKYVISPLIAIPSNATPACTLITLTFTNWMIKSRLPVHYLIHNDKKTHSLYSESVTTVLVCHGGFPSQRLASLPASHSTLCIVVSCYSTSRIASRFLLEAPLSPLQVP